MLVWLYREYGMNDGYYFCNVDIYDSYDKAYKRLEETKEDHAIGHDIIVNTNYSFACNNDKDNYIIECLIEGREVL